MDLASVLSLAGQFGPMGLLVGYLVWRDIRAERLAERRIDVDKELAGTLAVLSATVTGFTGRRDV